jgi:hypothetical protein
MWFLFKKLEQKVTPIQRSTVPTAGVRTKYSSWSSHISSHIQFKLPVLAREKRRKNTDKAGYLQLHMQRTPRDPEGIIVWMLFKQPVQQRILAPIYLLLPWVSGNIDLCQQRNGWSTALRQWLMLVKSSASILGDDNLFTQSFQLGIKMHRYWSGCKTQTLKHDLKMGEQALLPSYLPSHSVIFLPATCSQAASEPGHTPLVNLLTCSMVMNHSKDPKQCAQWRKDLAKPTFVWGLCTTSFQKRSSEPLEDFIIRYLPIIAVPINGVKWCFWCPAPSAPSRGGCIDAQSSELFPFAVLKLHDMLHWILLDPTLRMGWRIGSWIVMYWSYCMSFQ